MDTLLKSASKAASNTEDISSEELERHSEAISDLLIHSGIASSVGSINPAVIASYAVRFEDLINHSTNSLKINVIRKEKISSVEAVLDDIQLEKSKENYTAPRKKAAKTNQSPRCIRENTSKLKEFSSPKHDVKDFFGSLSWYKSNESYFDKRLRLVLADFQPSEFRGNEYHDYLLLDSRVTGLTEWPGFIHAVFFVGIGKYQRMFDHCMKEAANVWMIDGRATDKKISRILDIWRGEGAVIVLTTADGLLECEAQTRQALVIEALGKQRLCNKNNGSFYGTATALTAREKHELGATLLVKARKRFMKNGANCVFAPVKLKNS